MQNKNKSNKRSGKRAPRDKHLPLAAFTPSSKKVLMTFSAGQAQIESAAGLGTTYFYRLNSIYDPDQTGVGASVLGYSDWMDFFARYRVWKATVRLKGYASGMTAGGACNVVIAPISRSATVPANKASWKAIPYSKWDTIAQIGGHNQANFTATFDLAKVAKVTPAEYRIDADFAGTKGANPAREIFLMLGIDSIGSTTPVNLTWQIEITYLVELMDPFVLQ